MPRWSPESRQKQAEAIRKWSPWTKSTGPRTEEGRARSSRNAWKGGLRASLGTYRDVLRQIEQSTRLVISSFCQKRLSRPARQAPPKRSLYRHKPTFPGRFDTDSLPLDTVIARVSQYFTGLSRLATS